MATREVERPRTVEGRPTPCLVGREHVAVRLALARQAGFPSLRE